MLPVIVTIALLAIIVLFMRKKWKEEMKWLELQRIIIPDDTNKLIMTKKQLLATAENYAQNEKRILDDCAAIIQSTINPDAFFPRLDLAEKKIRNLVRLEPYIEFKGTLPSQAYKDFLGKEDEIVRDFIRKSASSVSEKADMMKTERGRNNQYEKYYESMSDYLPLLSVSNREYFTLLYNQMGRQ